MVSQVQLNRTSKIDAERTTYLMLLGEWLPIYFLQGWLQKTRAQCVWLWEATSAFLKGVCFSGPKSPIPISCSPPKSAYFGRHRVHQTSICIAWTVFFRLLGLWSRDHCTLPWSDNNLHKISLSPSWGLEKGSHIKLGLLQHENLFSSIQKRILWMFCDSNKNLNI